MNDLLIFPNPIDNRLQSAIMAIVKDSQTQKEYISSNLVQFRYENQTFTYYLYCVTDCVMVKLKSQNKRPSEILDK